MMGCQGLVGASGQATSQLTYGFFTLMGAQCWPCHWVLFVFKQSDYQSFCVAFRFLTYLKKPSLF